MIAKRQGKSARRGLGVPLMTSNGFSENQILVEQCLALASALISVCSALVSFYWFVRMRRSFRHSLIMLLIQSDMFKALWYFIHPIVVFRYGSVPSSSAFCQASGFFIALGIEASAVHTALCVFKSNNTVGGAGLYRYRLLAYICWLVFPLLVAVLAFVNPSNAYVSQGTFCYLPVRPFWYRLALSWIPRYIIFCVILSIYLSIYLYVRFKFSDFNAEGKDSYKAPSGGSPLHTQETIQSAPSPRMIGEHFAAPTPDNHVSGTEPDLDLTRPSGTRESNVAAEPNRTVINPLADPPQDLAPLWEEYALRNTRILQNSPSIQQIRCSSSGPVESDCSDSPTAPHSKGMDSVQTFRDRRVSSTAPLQANQYMATASLPHLSSDPHANPVTPRPATPSDPVNPQRLTLTDSHGHDYIAASLRHRHKVIKRQLRFLFIYPLVYMLMWVIPFISHTLMYSDRFAQNPPFVLVCFVTVIIALQAAVDCWLFSTREKPWRYIPGSSGTFWGSFVWWRREDGEQEAGNRVSAVGRNRREMEVDARDARQRKDEECQRLKEGRRLDKERKDSLADIGSEDKDWWEEEGKRRNDSVWMGTDVPSKSNESTRT